MMKLQAKHSAQLAFQPTCWRKLRVCNSHKPARTVFYATLMHPSKWVFVHLRHGSHQAKRSGAFNFNCRECRIVLAGSSAMHAGSARTTCPAKTKMPASQAPLPPSADSQLLASLPRSHPSAWTLRIARHDCCTYPACNLRLKSSSIAADVSGTMYVSWDSCSA